MADVKSRLLQLAAEGNKAIQKIGESYRVSKENKQRVIAIAGRNRP